MAHKWRSSWTVEAVGVHVYGGQQVACEVLGEAISVMGRITSPANYAIKRRRELGAPDHDSSDSSQLLRFFSARGFPSGVMYVT